ncbi:MAG: hypothetical protein K8S13_14940 [Desulfobacula sp.]|uniref:hypothetical protein n=1 Tax=Desulfobacula sp. TaxID=2593537 RepID=UPI0025C3CBA2|nr:hypothetical protein [Desulfobacula sp.]MCD4721134.1 hypothetical protein [Desulfobacula sp.]
MKQIITITTAVLLLICFSTVSAHADRKTMEGFMLGTGVAILGAAIINGINNDSRFQYSPNYSRHHRHHYAGYRQGYKNRYHRKCKPHRSRGYWEVERIWIKPVYKKKWNPGHYNRRGNWISGRHEKFIVQDGYFQEEKVWVWH